MNRYRLELATPADDVDLCQVLAATPTDGRIAVTFRRDPSWFAGAVVDGRMRQVVACRDLETGRVIGFGCRSVRDVYVNGRPAAVGYLSGLRLLPAHRHRGLLARGYAMVRDLHGDGRVPYYLTTIAAGNGMALDLLTSGRAGLPAYHQAGIHRTLAISLPHWVRNGRLRHGENNGALRIRTAKKEDLPSVLAFLREEGPRRQFFPRLGRDDFLTPTGAMRGLALDDLLLAERAGRLVGTAAAWDQRGDRRWVVDGYRGWLRWARPGYNAWAWPRGRPRLPPAGSILDCMMAALIVVADDDRDVFDALLKAVCDHAVEVPVSYLLLGMHGDDPLLPAARRFHAVTYETHVFIVCWPDGEAARAELDGRVPYLELGSL
jgi:hypothetical protein